MFRTIAARVPSDRDMPPRTAKLEVLRRVLDGTIYDVLPYEFHEEQTEGGEYVPLRKRAPSVRYNLCRLLVEDSIALLFGEGRFPTIECDDRASRDAIAALIKDSALNWTMIDAATAGSIGSAAILLRVLDGRLFFDLLNTALLTPVWQSQAPDTLERVVERYKVRGAVLSAQGYEIAPDAMGADFWFQRIWDADAETWFLPVPVATPAEPQIDLSRTVQHALGFVPVVWIRNLPGASSTGDAADGACTFRPAIETQIEIDYQLSQAGRGLKYSSDPTLLIKEPAAEGDRVGGASQALIVSEKGDAKLLEISGTASAAVVEYVRTLRELALESIHGNRSNADRVSAAQSGRALEMLHQPLIWLADNLRISYGDGLLRLVRMVAEASRKVGLIAAGQPVAPLADEPLSLRWPPWFTPTETDKASQAGTLRTLTDSGHMSRETAVKVVAPSYDIEDVTAELALIAKDEAEAAARADAEGAQIKATQTLPE